VDENTEPPIGFLRIECHIDRCPCYVLAWFGPVDIDWAWELLTDAAIQGGWVCTPGGHGPDYCGCGHTELGSRDTR
jgi:hypothetical protein